MTTKKKLSASFQPERLVRMRQEDIVLTEEMKRELRALQHRKIDFSDIPETDFRNAIRGKFYRPLKKQVTVRIDYDVLHWFQHHAKKYQTLINEACREYMMHHLKTKKKTRHDKKI